MSLSFLCLHHSKTSGHRVEDYFPALESWGFEVSAQELPSGHRQKMEWVESLPSYDVIYIHRLLLSPLLLPKIRGKAKTLIFDFDDAIMRRSSRHLIKWAPGRRWKFRSMMKAADHVIAGNAYLAEQARRHRSQVSVIPTSIDCQFFNGDQRKVSTKPSSEVVVGWSGRGEAHLPFLELLKQPVDDAAKQHPLRMRVVGVRQSEAIKALFANMDHAKVDLIDWVDFVEMPATIAGFDIGVMPLTDDDYARGKCALKLLEYMAMKVPVICSPVGVNQDIIDHGRNGMLAASPEEWKQSLQDLAANPTKRQSMGEAARQTVLDAYTKDKACQLFKQVLVKQGVF